MFIIKEGLTLASPSNPLNPLNPWSFLQLPRRVVVVAAAIVTALVVATFAAVLASLR